ncbi:hypothetical protein BKE17_02655 [Enhydrobacter sp. H5]|nr:hypothetical protein BKE17_02655 [Enhydrobacter sp. H5]
MAAIVHSDKAKKAIKKIKEAMQDYPLGIEFGELMQKTGYAKSSLYSALSLVGAQKSDDGLWHLPCSQNFVAPVNETAEGDLDDNFDDLATAIDHPVKQDDGGNMQDNGGNTQDAPVNMQDEELNTQAHQVSSPVSDVAPHISLVDNEPGLVDNHDSLVDINTDIDLDWSIAPKWANYRTVDKDNLAKWHENKPVLGATIWSSIGLTESTGYIKGLINWQTSLRQRPQSDNADEHLHPDFAALPDHQSSHGQAIETAPVAESEEEFELQPPPIATKHYLLIENCTLSLAQDGTGQEPVLAKDIWVDDEGEELEESDCQVMRRAREPLSNWVDFRGVTYRNLFIVNNAQIFHGVFDSIKAAHDKMAELTAKKRGNFFEVIEV